MFPVRPWYAVRCVFRRTGYNLYEERIILVKASSYEEALDKAEKEAEEYAEALEDFMYTGYAEAFHLFDEKLKDGTEVYSTMRESELESTDYIKRFLRTGKELGFKDKYDEEAEGEPTK